MPGVPGQRGRGCRGWGATPRSANMSAVRLGYARPERSAEIIGDGPRLPDRSPHVAATSKRGDYAAATFDVSTNCDTHLLRRFRLARYISSNSAGGKECVDRRPISAAPHALSSWKFLDIAERLHPIEEEIALQERRGGRRHPVLAQDLDERWAGHAGESRHRRYFKFVHRVAAKASPKAGLPGRRCSR